MMSLVNVKETIKTMNERVLPMAANFADTFSWPGDAYTSIATKADALAMLAQTRAVGETPEVVLRAADRLVALVENTAAAKPAQFAAFEHQIVEATVQNWSLPPASEELRAASEELRGVLREMEAGQRIEIIYAAVKNSQDAEARKILGAIFPFGLHWAVTGLPHNQLLDLRESFVSKELPGVIAARDMGLELFENLETMLKFAGDFARSLHDLGALQALENDRAVRAAAQQRLAQ